MNGVVNGGRIGGPQKAGDTPLLASLFATHSEWFRRRAGTPTAPRVSARRSVAGVKGRWFVSVWGLASPQPTTERKEISLRAARRFGLRFAFSNARPPLPPPRAAFCETRPNFGCIVVKPRGAGALGFASPF